MNKTERELAMSACTWVCEEPPCFVTAAFNVATHELVIVGIFDGGMDDSETILWGPPPLDPGCLEHVYNVPELADVWSRHEALQVVKEWGRKTFAVATW